MSELPPEDNDTEVPDDSNSQGDIDSLLNEAQNEENEPKEEVNEVLSQGDIDSLIQSSIDEDKPSIIQNNGKRFADDSKVQINTYDFLNPIFLTEVELRQVRIRNEQFIHYLSARLSMALRMDFALKMSQLTTMPYAKFTESIPNPSYISLFSINQKKGIGILAMNARLAMTIVNRLLGGKGHSIRDERYLTEIEIALMEDMVHIILEKWAQQWSDIEDVATSIVGVENNGRFLQTAPGDAIVLVVSMEASIGDCSESMQVGIPYYCLEPIIRKLHESNKQYDETKKEKIEPQWRTSHEEIKIPVIAEWNAFDITLGDFLKLKPGDVLEFPKSILTDAQIRFKDSTRFTGEVGVQNDCVAVKIIDKVEEE